MRAHAVAVFTALRALRYAGADAAAARTAASAISAGAITADLAAANTQVAKHAADVKAGVLAALEVIAAKLGGRARTKP